MNLWQYELAYTKLSLLIRPRLFEAGANAIHRINYYLAVMCLPNESRYPLDSYLFGR